MLRRLSISAALAALAVPVALSGAATAADGGTPGGDPAAQTQTRKQQPRVLPRAQQRAAQVSRSASRMRAERRAQDEAPLSVSIEQLTPSTLPDRGMVRVSGTVTNNDTVTWSTINIRPFISATPLTTPEQLADAAKQPPDAVVGARINDEQHKDFIEELGPGDSAPYTLSIPRRLLPVSTPGVYWFGVHALGENPDGRDETADGRARTFLPLVPDARVGQEPTAVVIPLRRPLSYTDDGRVGDLAGWVQTLSQGGRLRSLVDFGASAGDRTVTWVVDPALVDAVRRLADGNPPRSLAPNLQAGQDDGEGAAGETGEPSAEPTPTTDPSATPSADASETPESPLDLDQLDPVVQAAAKSAQAWLARLGEAMRPEDQVMTLPYGDVDVAGAAAHDPQLLQRALARSGSTLPGFDVATTPVLASPSGFLSPKGIAAAGPDTTIILNDAMFEDPEVVPSVADVGGHRVVAASSGASAGGPGPDSRTASTAMRQRLLSEAAVRFLQADHAPLTMVLPHDWNPSDGGSFFGGLDADWLDLTSVAGVEQAVPAPPQVTALHYPRWQQETELGQPSFEAAEQLIRSGVTLQNLLTLNNLVAGTVTDEALGTTSYAARTRPIASRAAADASRAWIDDRLAQVHVSAPRAVTLSSSNGRFQATITNDLDEPVTVALEASGGGRLTIDGPKRVDVPAHGRFGVLLTARTTENGIHDVRLVVTDKHGTPLGATTDLTIRSAQVSNVIWLFLAIGGALLFGAIAVRLVRRIRRSRRAPAGGPTDGEGGDGGEPAELKEPAGAGTR